MVFKRNIFKTLCILGIILFGGLFSACDMLGGIYDDTLDGGNPEKKDAENTATTSSMYLDARSYTQWIYIDLHNTTPTTTTSEISLDDFSETGKPDKWDIAIHRYDIKTNGAKAIMTSYRTITELEAAGLPTNPQWVADEYLDEAIWVDMSHMLDGYIVYAPSYKNVEASRWINVDISYMPPTYTTNTNVILLQFSDGTYAALQLEDFMSKDRYQYKGCLTINYKYPIFKQ